MVMDSAIIGPHCETQLAILKRRPTILIGARIELPFAVVSRAKVLTAPSRRAGERANIAEAGRNTCNVGRLLAYNLLLGR